MMAKKQITITADDETGEFSVVSSPEMLRVEMMGLLSVAGHFSFHQGLLEHRPPVEDSRAPDTVELQNGT